MSERRDRYEAAMAPCYTLADHVNAAMAVADAEKEQIIEDSAIMAQKWADAREENARLVAELNHIRTELASALADSLSLRVELDGVRGALRFETEENARTRAEFASARSDILTDDFGQPIRECYECDRVGCTSAPQPECAASTTGHCLAEYDGETACATEDGECVHGGRPAPQPTHYFPCPLFGDGRKRLGGPCDGYFERGQWDAHLTAIHAPAPQPETAPDAPR